MKRILVVDDDGHLRELLAATLGQDGRTVDVAQDGVEALALLGANSYDVVLSDLRMPGLDGPAVYRAIERQPPPRPAVIFVTGYADAGRYEEFLRTVQVPVVGKPFDINVLRDVVRRRLSGT